MLSVHQADRSNRVRWRGSPRRTPAVGYGRAWAESGSGPSVRPASWARAGQAATEPTTTEHRNGAHVAPTAISRLAHWQRLVIVAIALPVLVGLAVLAFAYPAARAEPRQLPVGVIGTSAGNQQLVEHVTAHTPNGFDFHLYPDDASARAAIRHRDVYGAFQVIGHRVRLMTATAASPAVAELLQQLAGTLVRQAESAHSGTTAQEIHTDDIVPLSSDDPKGTVFSACLLPLTICSMLVAAATGLVVRFRPAWRQILALMIVSMLSAATVYLIGQTYLGAFPHHGFADWGVLALTILAISTSTAGLIALIGAAGLALGAALMVFVGNPFAGTTSAPELLPGAINRLGQLLPPGAGSSALRNTAYFDGSSLGTHLAVLSLWAVLGLAALIIGHHAPIQLAAQRLSPGEVARHEQQPPHRRSTRLRARLARRMTPHEAAELENGVGEDTPHARERA